MEESENSPEIPHLREIKRMRKQCVPDAPPFFMCAGDEASTEPVRKRADTIFSAHSAVWRQQKLTLEIKGLTVWSVPKQDSKN